MKMYIIYKYFNLILIEVPNLILLHDHLQKEGKLQKKDLIDIINKFVELVSKEPNVLTLQDPITVVGDIHGQFYDIGKIMEVGGNPEKNKYLFLGDYVDRGMFSIEVIIYLYCMKVRIKHFFNLFFNFHIRLFILLMCS